MRIVRAAVSLAAAASFAVSMQCGNDATELEVEILATDCATVTSTTVRTGVPGNVSLTDPAKAKKPGCTDGRIGSVVLFPSGADDAQVEIDVVTGFGKDADQCAPTLEGCIHARRITRFVSGTSTKVRISMDPRCVGKVCPAGQTCSAGGCVSAENADGAVPPGGEDAGGSDAPSGDAGPVDGCTKCATAGGACRDGACVFKCDSTTKCSVVACPPGMSCVVDCQGAGACGNITCDGPDCTISCIGLESQAFCGAITCGGSGTCKITGGRTGDVKCTAAKCDVTCYTCGRVDINPTGPGSVAHCAQFFGLSGTCDFNCAGETCTPCRGGRYTCEPMSTPKCTKTQGC